MRSVLLFSLVALAASPVVAAPRHADDADVARMADRLNDPAMQSAMAGMMTGLADVLMSMRLEPLRAAIGRFDPDAAADLGDGARTLGEAVERDDPNFRDRLDDQARGGAAMMGGMASGMAAMLPELRRMGERMGREMERAAERSGRNFPQR